MGSNNAPKAPDTVRMNISQRAANFNTKRGHSPALNQRRLARGRCLSLLRVAPTFGRNCVATLLHLPRPDVGAAIAVRGEHAGPLAPPAPRRPWASGPPIVARRCTPEARALRSRGDGLPLASSRPPRAAVPRGQLSSWEIHVSQDLHSFSIRHSSFNIHYFRAIWCWILPHQLRAFSHQHVGIAITADGTPVIKMIRELSVPADHEIRLQSRPGQAVVCACAFVVP